MSDTVKLDLLTAQTHKGIAYGPGEGIEVPKAAAERWGLADNKKAAKAEKSPKGGKK